MAASATPKTADCPAVVAVAYSGGRDSTALLHAVAAAAGVEIIALHVHHGLSAHADAWAAHCEAQCAAWGVAFQCHRLIGRPAPAQSVEAWARDGRHAALQQMAVVAGADLLLLAQHRRDQAETFMLQALRGAGAAGLAAMPAVQWRDGVCWARPWLQQPREAINAYIARHALSHIEDDSNSDLRFARNRLRLAVWPGLSEAFPQAEASLARSADWAQQALALQHEMAEADLAAIAGDSGLDVAGVRALSPARASNALRAWLHAQCGRPAPASLIERLQREWLSSAGAWPCAGGVLHLYRGRLSWLDAGVTPGAAPSQSVNLASAGLHAQPDWGGCWRVDAVTAGGVSAVHLQDLTVRGRQGGEQFQHSVRSSLRSLKKAYQQAAIPAWQRDGPLLFWREQLLFAPGLGLDARLLAAPGEPQFGLSWLPSVNTAG